ncbi:hypothetical protein LPK89_15085 [Klebsiella pneumoniae]|uniref:hypothetical protein n=1 Tax=Klebsiella pneumoniae TaxID=573 RepID=UPI002DBD4C6D|nr:hypothetical protein [Klebsiella pneumoniae]MCJ6018132.1 hypothetical protein [Klebsiella pneumoniae]MEC4456433.1 hypothetical protein [Klebsiella pneumoniae]
MKNKIEKKTKQKKGWIKDLTEYEKSIFVNMLNEAAMKKRRWVTKKERLEVTNRFREVVNALREANRIKDNKNNKNNKDNVVPEQKIVSEVDVSDDIKVKKERKPRVRNIDNYGRLRKVSLSERNFLNDAVSEATEVKKSRLTDEERRKVLCVAREQIRSQRKANQIKSVRTKEKHSEVFEWKRPETFRR